jgi:cytochrome c-type biogenesis protein CcmH
MVAQLAAKQAADPGNFDGWMRLGRAYAVLGQMDQSADAYAKARALRPEDLSVPEAEAEALMTGFKPGEKLPAQVIALMNEVVAKDPKQPMALWYLGLNAAQNGQAAEARQRWQALADQLPTGSDDRKMVEQALATLPSAK